MSVALQLMTTEEFLTLPDDGVDRDLIRGELREKPMTTRSTPHCFATAYLSHYIIEWVLRQPLPRGRVYGGEIRVRLRREPDTMVGVDLIYISAEHAARTSPLASFVDGPPVLAVEVISPSDTAEDIATKVKNYLGTGVALVWEVNPYYRTVIVHRPDGTPRMFDETQELTAEPHLPGFRVPVARIFAD